MKKIYSIGYIDQYGDFRKVWDKLGYTLKFATIEEAENYINNKLDKNYVKPNTLIKIMQGWKIIKEV